MILILTLQAVAGPMLPAEPRPATDRQCPPAAAGNDEVVVCGRQNQEAFRLRPLTAGYDKPTLPKAETSLFGGAAKGAAEVEGASVGGVQSNRLMFRLKTPF